MSLYHLIDPGAPPAADEPAREPEPTPPEEGPGADLVFVVDDDNSVSHSLRVLLTSCGFAVVTYASGAAFLADDRRRRAGVLVIDHHMPGMDGLEVVAAQQSENIPIPTIVITGRLDSGIAERAGKLGVSAVVEKPFAVARLVELIRAGLDGRH